MSKSQTVESTVSTPEVIAFCLANKLDAMMVGKWVWVSFAEKPARQMCQTLRERGFVFSRRHRKWAHNCGHPAKSATISNPFEKYACQRIADNA